MVGRPGLEAEPGLAQPSPTCDASAWVGRRSFPRAEGPKGKEWWAAQDLNLKPTDYESAALTN